MGDILFLCHRIPYPPNRGDKIRAFNILKYLSKKRRVHLVTFADECGDMAHKAALARYTASQAVVWRGKSNEAAALEALVRHKPVSLTAFENRALQSAIDRLFEQSDIDTIYCFSGQMAQYVPLKPRARFIMDFCDVDSVKFDQYATNEAFPKNLMMKREARLLGAYERGIANRARASLFVSDAEAELFRRRSGAERVMTVENGIDTGHFDPRAAFRPVDEAGPLIVFTGQMDYPPNVEAVRWFANDILPHVRERHAKARFAIVGRNPTEAVKALASDGVIVTGEVEDVRGWLAAASVAVAPLKLARGIQNKVLEAMAMGLPVVATSSAAEGIDHDGTIRASDDATGFAEQVCALLSDAKGARAQGKAARERVIARYGWDARLAALDDLVGQGRPQAAGLRNAA